MALTAYSSSSPLPRLHIQLYIRYSDYYLPVESKENRARGWKGEQKMRHSKTGRSYRIHRVVNWEALPLATKDILSATVTSTH